MAHIITDRRAWMNPPTAPTVPPRTRPSGPNPIPNTGMMLLGFAASKHVPKYPHTNPAVPLISPHTAEIVIDRETLMSRVGRGAVRGPGMCRLSFTQRNARLDVGGEPPAAMVRKCVSKES